MIKEKINRNPLNYQLICKKVKDSKTLKKSNKIDLWL